MIAVVVSTGEHKGIFFGYIEKKEIPEDNKIKLINARMCVYFSENVHGFVGLASWGPNNRCKITPSVPEIYLSEVNSIMVCTEKAKEEWEKEHWG